MSTPSPSDVGRLVHLGIGNFARSHTLLSTDVAGGWSVVAFTGRPARGLRNAFVDEFEPQAVTGYPAVHLMTRELRSRAAAAGERRAETRDERRPGKPQSMQGGTPK